MCGLLGVSGGRAEGSMQVPSAALHLLAAVARAELHGSGLAGQTVRMRCVESNSNPTHPTLPKMAALECGVPAELLMQLSQREGT